MDDFFCFIAFMGRRPAWYREWWLRPPYWRLAVIAIPIDEGKWHRIAPEDMPLPKDHFAEYCRSEGKLIVRIVGPNAHVTGDDKNLEAAIKYALKWFSEVGGEL